MINNVSECGEDAYVSSPALHCRAQRRVEMMEQERREGTQDRTVGCRRGR